MPDSSQTRSTEDAGSAQKKLSQVDPSEDGRSKEWQERARVSLETVPEGTTTNVERDFEPESLNEEENDKNKKDNPAY